ncbi:MAG: sugar phosphate isomerase/epimerase family protein [Acidimicrobiia bacterium]
MQLGLYTDSVSAFSLEEALDLAAEVGAAGIEIAAGGQSTAPHMEIDRLLEDGRARERFAAACEERGLRIAALNCSAWPLHPVKDAPHQELIRKVIRLASLLGVPKIVTMSGTPGDGPGATFLNWVWYPWPEEGVELLERQWDQAVPVWQELAALAIDQGVERIALELHPLHLVYNVPTLIRMREAVGEVIGANVDPSHMFWQQMDPVTVVRALGPAVHHVHLKDTELVAGQVALAGVLDNRPFEPPEGRAWVFRTIGRSHGARFWSGFLGALAEVGYDDVLSIENEDPDQPQAEGVREAAAFIRPLLAEYDGLPPAP